MCAITVQTVGKYIWVYVDEGRYSTHRHAKTIFNELFVGI